MIDVSNDNCIINFSLVRVKLSLVGFIVLIMTKVFYRYGICDFLYFISGK